MNQRILIGKNLLETITSALYEDPIILFREYVQNSVDAYKKAIQENGKPELSEFQVNIDVDRKKRSIIVRDNGYGIYPKPDVSPLLIVQEFNKKMLSFGESDKNSQPTKYIGFRGIGRISAMPFCKKLRFVNKPEGVSERYICEWQGDKYKELLNSNSKDSFDDIVRRIISFSTEKNQSNNDHYFTVEIIDYSLDVEELLGEEKTRIGLFEQRLMKMLPLRYKSDFKSAKKIIDKYNEFMDEDLNDFMYSIVLNGKELSKNYSDEHVLEAGINFWEIRGKQRANGRPGDKMGILWFTFNHDLEAVKKHTSDYGILVRSKNVLMGSNDKFVELCVNSNKYVSTSRELTQAMKATCGELLINYPELKDNARREWFRIDEKSLYLRNLIVDFMEKLHKCRYSASRYYHGPHEENKNKFKHALTDLISANIDHSGFFKIDPKKRRENVFQIADEDMPSESMPMKRAYDNLMVIIKDFFRKKNTLELFLELRAYIKKSYSKK
ncbi:MAG: ATP-binding protein [Candidatus Wallbacteria bacterium]|nr:ATP-binding protein [Candidatus Wallbacteria bacterium]